MESQRRKKGNTERGGIAYAGAVEIVCTEKILIVVLHC